MTALTPHTQMVTMTAPARRDLTAAERDPRWAAVAARDRSADGSFVYSVATTGVYCRPSCPSRRANPKNIQFHRTAADAERAGFRPCKRCRPTERSRDQVQAAAIARICRAIESSDSPPALADLAARAGMSPYHFHRVFKAITGVTPRAYAAAARSTRVRRELRDRTKTVTEAIYEAGYGSGSRFYETAAATLGMTPRDYRSGGADQQIRFAVAQCSLGSALIAQSARGLCAILLGDDPEALVRDLQDRFPRATLIGADAAFERTIARVIGFLETPARGLDLPLDVRGTAFQQRVWQALRTIPVGSTASYSEIARRIGSPTSVR
ncbi:MAG TPA: bifunctional DNA-binding transcriptional regulator/O6-methylguanine-DNA methyltransferase Ada, partial [Vicinamibacterales bacterium]|nr:bifunctional DNA-binding transcriptional regulator/O6-methylguanine-DNA methyltransferase Ada [Vicinamibacterales bacterium]